MSVRILSKDAPYGADGRGAWLLELNGRQYLAVAMPECQSTRYWAVQLGHGSEMIPELVTIKAATWVYPVESVFYRPVAGGQGMTFEQAVADLALKGGDAGMP